MADIPGISHSLCMHKILFKDGDKTVSHSQRKINPLIIDVVKNEITKLLQLGIIYPISDSNWISLEQMVPKKFGLTMPRNEKKN